MRVRLLSLLPAIAAVAFLGIAHADDDAAKNNGQKPEAKKDCDTGCCGKDKAAAKPETAKKDDDCGDEGCCEKDKGAPVSAKQMTCADCEKNKAPGSCDRCKAAVKSGAVSVVPIKGMACGACENKVAAKLDAIDAVAKFCVSSQTNVAAIIVAPGKTVRLSEIAKSLDGTKFSVDEDAALAGRVTFALGCTACPMCPEGEKASADKGDCSKKLLESVGKLAGVEKVAETQCEKGKECLFTVQLAEGSKVSFKQLRETVAAQKLQITDFVLVGAPAKAGS